MRRAIESRATLGSYYQGTGQVIVEELIRSEVPSARIGAERDRIILAASMSYLMTMHPVLIRTTWEDFVLGFVHPDNARIAHAPFYANRYAAVDRGNHPEPWTQIGVLPSLGMENATIICDASCRDPYIHFWRMIPLGALMPCFRCRIVAAA